MYAEERQQHILELLKRKKRVDVASLAGRLDASPETIRRDLNELEADGFLKRTHGGAIYLEDHSSRPLMSHHSRRAVNFDKKSGIAKVAAGFVQRGDVIAIDNSTTACRMVEFLPADMKLTVITYSLHVILEIVAKPNCAWTCIDLGGVVHPQNMSTHGILTGNALELFHPGKLFMSCAGIGPNGEMTEGTMLDTEVKRALLKASRETYLLVDGTKWGQTGAVNEGNVADVDCLITNGDVDPAKYAFLRNGKVKLLFDK